MPRKISDFAAAILIMLAALPAAGASQTFEFHADARMQHERFGPIEQAYGYLQVVTNDDGNGTINVMFSNGSGLDLEQFNARVKFLDAADAVIGEEHFDCWLDAEGLDEAIECKVTKPLALSGFKSIEVDFFLSGADEIDTAVVY